MPVTQLWVSRGSKNVSMACVPSTRTQHQMSEWPVYSAPALSTMLLALLAYQESVSVRVTAGRQPGVTPAPSWPACIYLGHICLPHAPHSIIHGGLLAASELGKQLTWLDGCSSLLRISSAQTSCPRGKPQGLWGRAEANGLAFRSRLKALARDDTIFPP